MNNNNSIDDTIINNWVNEKYTIAIVEEKLKAMGYDVLIIAEYIAAFKKQKRNKRQLFGFYFIILGAFLGFVSCSLTILNPFPQYYNLILYGLTSIAIVAIFLGLYYVFED